MRLISSEMPCAASSVKPIGSRILTGQRSKPPALADISLILIDSAISGSDSQSTRTTIGSRKNSVPMMSITARPRGESLPESTSMRTCSFLRSV